MHDLKKEPEIYTNIYINSNNQFLITENKEAQESAHKRMLCIERIVERELKYAEDVEDAFSQLPQHELYSILKQRAEVIQDEYLNKTAQLSLVTRLFCKTSKKEAAIQAIFNRIANPADLAPLINIPDELIRYIFGFLQISDLSKVIQVNRYFELSIKDVEFRRAQDYGYRGQDFAEAKNYLHNLFRSISTLAKGDYLPKEYVVKKGQWPFWRYIDSEATFRRVKNYWLTSDIDHQTENDRYTTLHYASTQGHTEIVGVLLDYGTNPNIANRAGYTPLHCAVIQRQTETVEILLEYKAKLNTANSLGYTPLHFAATQNQAEIVQILLDHGANPNIVHHPGGTPLHFAATQNQAETVKILLNHGADLSLTDHAGNTPLHLAANRGEAEIVKILLDHGADRYILNNQEQTPYQLVRWNNWHLSWLLEYYQPMHQKRLVL